MLAPGCGMQMEERRRKVVKIFVFKMFAYREKEKVKPRGRTEDIKRDPCMVLKLGPISIKSASLIV